MPVWWWFSWVNYMCVNSLSRVYRAYFNFSLCALILVADDEIPRQLLISRWYVLVLGMTQVLIWNFVVSIHCYLRWFPIRPFWLYLKSRVAKKYGSIQWRALSKHLCPEPPHHQCNLMFIPFANGLWISFDSQYMVVPRGKKVQKILFACIYCSPSAEQIFEPMTDCLLPSLISSLVCVPRDYLRKQTPIHCHSICALCLTHADLKQT